MLALPSGLTLPSVQRSLRDAGFCFPERGRSLATVLCTGSNRTLNETRALLLKDSGHDVICAIDDQEVREACEGKRVAVAVIGQSISNSQNQRMVLLVRQYSQGTLILELYIPSLGKALTDADEWLDVPNQYPEKLIQRVNNLTARYLSSWRPSADSEA